MAQLGLIPYGSGGLLRSYTNVLKWFKTDSVIIKLSLSQITIELLKGPKKIGQIRLLPFIVIFKKALHFVLENTPTGVIFF